MSPLFTDLYQLTMAQAYLSSRKANQSAVFELFFRKCPFGGEFAVFSGLQLVRDVLENFHFSENQVQYLRSLNIFSTAPESFFKELLQMDASDIEIKAAEEGSLCFARVPLLQVKGPLFKLQLLESALLNAVNFSTLASTYARHLWLAANKKSLVEFGMRRAQGPNGAMAAARASYIGGFVGSSNVLAGQEFGIPVIGTMAHSFVQSFSELSENELVWPQGSIEKILARAKEEDELKTNEGELAAFLAFAKTYPNDSMLLIDTYNSLESGLPNAIRTFKVLREFGYQAKGVRLDSGDLVHLSKEVRKELDKEGFQEAQIFASNELSRSVIASLEKQGAKIDGYGVGTKMATCFEQPALGGVYKLVELNEKPRIKVSEQTEKSTLPGEKKAFRIYGKDEKMILDLLMTKKEAKPVVGTEIEVFHPLDRFKSARLTPVRVEEILKPLFSNNRFVELKSLEEVRANSLRQMDFIREDISRQEHPTPYKVSISLNLKNQFEKLYRQEAPPKSLNR